MKRTFYIIKPSISWLSNIEFVEELVTWWAIARPRMSKSLQSLFIPDCEVEQAVATVMYKLKTERPTQNTAYFACKEFDANIPGA